MPAPVPSIHILSRDQTYLVAWKPPGLKVYRDDKKEPKQAKEHLEDQLGEKLYPVHRLDKDTEGLVLFARDPQSAKAFIDQFKRRKVQKIYQALVWGAPTSPHGKFTASLAKNKEPDVKEPAQTEFIVMRAVASPGEGLPAMTWLRLHPMTGRFHQIRRHLVGAGMPIVGDPIYGAKDRDQNYFDQNKSEPRLHLWAVEIEFSHPKTQKRVKVSREPKL